MDDLQYKREEHRMMQRKNELKEISYQNLSILNRIKNVKSNINHQTQDRFYEN